MAEKHDINRHETSVTRILITPEWKVKVVARASPNIFGVTTYFVGACVRNGELNEVWKMYGDPRFFTSRLFAPASLPPSPPLTAADLINQPLPNREPVRSCRLIGFAMLLISLPLLMKSSRGNPKWIKWTSGSIAVGTSVGNIQWFSSYRDDSKHKAFICCFVLFNATVSVIGAGLLYYASLEATRKIGYAIASMSLALGIWMVPVPFVTPTPHTSSNAEAFNSSKAEPLNIVLQVTESRS